MDWVSDGFPDGSGRGNVVYEPTYWDCLHSAHVDLLPLAEQPNEEVAFESTVEHLRQEVQVRHQGCLQDYWDIGGIEEFDRVGAISSSYLIVLNRDVDFEALEVDDHHENQDSGTQVRQVGQVVADEC